MPELVLVHSSDLHIDDEDTPDDPRNGLASLRVVLATARHLAADLVLLAGDTFDNHRIATPVLHAAARLLADAAMPVVVLPGNHDPILPDCIFRRAGLVTLPHVHVLGVTDPEDMLLANRQLDLRGRAHRGYDDVAPLHAPRSRTARWQVIMAHGHHVPQADWQREAHRSWRISDAELAATGADYIALGHWDRATPAGPRIARAYYSGAPHLADSVNVIRLGPAGVAVERVSLDWTK